MLYIQKNVPKSIIIEQDACTIYSCGNWITDAVDMYVKSNSVINTLLEAIDYKCQSILQNTKQAVKKFYCYSYHAGWRRNS